MYLLTFLAANDKEGQVVFETTIKENIEHTSKLQDTLKMNTEYMILIDKEITASNSRKFGTSSIAMANFLKQYTCHWHLPKCSWRCSTPFNNNKIQDEYPSDFPLQLTSPALPMAHLHQPSTLSSHAFPILYSPFPSTFPL